MTRDYIRSNNGLHITLQNLDVSSEAEYIAGERL